MTARPRAGIRLTSPAQGLVLVGVCSAAAGLGLGYREFIGLSGAAIGLLAVAFVQIARPVAVRVERTVAPDRVSVGETAIGMLKVLATGRGRALQAVDTVGDRRHEVLIPRAAGDEVRRVLYELDTSRRGVFAVGPLRLRQRDLFDLLYREQDLGTPAQLIVRPQVYEVRQPARGRARDLAGPRSTAGAESGVTFAGLREYVPGDDLRIVHWKGLARGGPLTVRVHDDSTHSDVLVLLDDRAASYTDAEEFEQAVSFAASIARMAATVGVNVRISPVTSRELSGPMVGVMDGLAGITTSPDSSAGSLTGSAQQAAARGGRTAVAVLGERSIDELSALVPLQQTWSSVVAAVVAQRRPASITGAGVPVISARTAADLAAAWNQRWA